MRVLTGEKCVVLLHEILPFTVLFMAEGTYVAILNILFTHSTYFSCHLDSRQNLLRVNVAVSTHMCADWRNVYTHVNNTNRPPTGLRHQQSPCHELRTS